MVCVKRRIMVFFSCKPGEKAPSKYVQYRKVTFKIDLIRCKGHKETASGTDQFEEQLQ